MLSQEIDRIGFSHGGCHDNHTVAIVEMMSDSILQDEMSNKLKTLIAAGAAMLLVSLIVNIVCLSKLGGASDNGLIDKMREENVRLSEYQMKYEALQKLVGQDRQESIDENFRLQKTVDSLYSVIEEMRVAALMEQPEQKKDKEDVHKNRMEKPVKGLSMSNAAIINNVIARLEETKNFKNKEQRISVEKKKAALEKAMEFLNELQKQTKGRYGSDISSLSRRLIGKKQRLLYVVMDNNKNFVSTTTASQELDKLIQDAKKLKSKIK